MGGLVSANLARAMHILVVEDDRSIRETIGIVLEAYHHQAELVADSRETLAALERSIEHWPDVLILDLKLATESGEEVHERIKARFGRVPPTVVISAAQEGARRASRIPGAKFLSKPYTIDQLLECIEEVASAAHLKSSSA
jgi:DNA-binding response OmpR family regulator